MNLPEYVKLTLSRLEENGHSAYLVGGCVRDYIMEKQPHDFDITTSATPCEIQDCFCDIKTLDIGKKHGTITLVFDKECVEVTTYRIDGEYHDSRHPDSVEFTDKIELDLARRDFTMNAIAYSPKRGFCDPFCGREDIERRIIRCVGNASERFSEDALRILRCLRFASRLGFDIDDDTSRSIFDKTHLLSKIAAERITSEVLGVLNDAFCFDVLKKYKSVFEFLYPSLSGKLDNLSSRVLSHGIYGLFSVLEGQDITPILKNMKLDTRTVKSVSNVVFNLQRARMALSKSDLKKLAVNIGADDAIKCLELLEMHSQRDMLVKAFDNGECMSVSQLCIDGTDLLPLANGQIIGQTLNTLLFEVIEEKCVNDKNILLNRAEELLRS